jgi:hypothetical protein
MPLRLMSSPWQRERPVSFHAKPLGRLQNNVLRLPPGVTPKLVADELNEWGHARPHRRTLSRPTPPD